MQQSVQHTGSIKSKTETVPQQSADVGGRIGTVWPRTAMMAFSHQARTFPPPALIRLVRTHVRTADMFIGSSTDESRQAAAVQCL